MAETPLASSYVAEALDFESLVMTHGRFVFNVAYAVLRNPQDAEDVAQETFFRAFRSGDLEKVERVRPWLGRIGWRLAINRVKQRAGIEKKVQSEDILRTLPARETGADELLIREERTILLERLLCSLPRDLREAFVLLTVEEMTSHGAAEILGISESSVRDRVFRARKLMKEKLAALMEGRHEP